MIPGLDIVAQVQPVAAYSWPAALVVIAGFALQAWIIYTQQQNKVSLHNQGKSMRDNTALTMATKVKVDESVAKVDVVHDLFNSRLDEWKKTQEEQSVRDLESHKAAFEASLTKMNAEHKASALADVTELNKRIASLENMINSMRPAMPPVGPAIAPISPEKRLEEIRGQE